MQGLDIETYNPETGGGELDPEKGNVRLVQIRDDGRGRVYDGHDPAVPDALRKLEEQVAHNATFERRWIARHYGIDLDLDDTMVMSQVYHTGTNAARAKQFSHSLQAVVKRELKRELDKTELRKVHELERRVSHAVDQMERNGFGIDLVRLDAFIAESTEQA